uniref:UPF0556 protein C19orf10 homolog n=1 Tax=Mesocestoides corti TaxID=53468 RepID=A0A5K3FQC7_MESCO
MYKYFILCVVLAHSVLSSDTASKNIKIKEISVKPGGVTRTESIEGFGVVCTFEYSCQGGTGEGWHLSIVYSEKQDRYVCHVQRTGNSISYLFFQKFVMTVADPAAMTSGVAFDDKSKLLDPAEYFVDTKRNSISHVGGKFKGHLGHVSLEFEMKSRRPEL